MAIERAVPRYLAKPWGSHDLRPWSRDGRSVDAIGEIWFERSDLNTPPPALLLKLLFTTEPLSIQVHPDDDAARALGLPNGKTEAWYVLNAAPGAGVALGLKLPLTVEQLSGAIADGSIADLVAWRSVAQSEALLVPAGTIHAIGAGLVIAEIQQRSDATFRLFDHGRERELHISDGVAVADRDVAEGQTTAVRLSSVRTRLIADAHFVLERIVLPPESTWRLEARVETWALIVDGQADIGLFEAGVGEAVFLDKDRASLVAGPAGASILLAYLGPQPNPNLLQPLYSTESNLAAQRFFATVLSPDAKSGTPQLHGKARR